MPNPVKKKPPKAPINSQSLGISPAHKPAKSANLSTRKHERSQETLPRSEENFARRSDPTPNITQQNWHLLKSELHYFDHYKKVLDKIASASNNEKLHLIKSAVKTLHKLDNSKQHHRCALQENASKQTLLCFFVELFKDLPLDSDSQHPDSIENLDTFKVFSDLMTRLPADTVLLLLVHKNPKSQEMLIEDFQKLSYPLRFAIFKYLSLPIVAHLNSKEPTTPGCSTQSLICKHMLFQIPHSPDTEAFFYLLENIHQNFHSICFHFSENSFALLKDPHADQFHIIFTDLESEKLKKQRINSKLAFTLLMIHEAKMDQSSELSGFDLSCNTPLDSLTKHIFLHCDATKDLTPDESSLSEQRSRLKISAPDLKLLQNYFKRHQENFEQKRTLKTHIESENFNDISACLEKINPREKDMYKDFFILQGKSLLGICIDQIDKKENADISTFGYLLTFYSKDELITELVNKPKPSEATLLEKTLALNTTPQSKIIQQILQLLDSSDPSDALEDSKSSALSVLSNIIYILKYCNASPSQHAQKSDLIEYCKSFKQSFFEYANQGIVEKLGERLHQVSHGIIHPGQFLLEKYQNTDIYVVAYLDRDGKILVEIISKEEALLLYLHYCRYINEALNRNFSNNVDDEPLAQIWMTIYTHFLDKPVTKMPSQEALQNLNKKLNIYPKFPETFDYHANLETLYQLIKGNLDQQKQQQEKIEALKARRDRNKSSVKPQTNKTGIPESNHQSHTHSHLNQANKEQEHQKNSTEPSTNSSHRTQRRRQQRERAKANSNEQEKTSLQKDSLNTLDAKQNREVSAFCSKKEHQKASRTVQLAIKGLLDVEALPKEILSSFVFQQEYMKPLLEDITLLNTFIQEFDYNEALLLSDTALKKWINFRETLSKHSYDVWSDEVLGLLQNDAHSPSAFSDRLKAENSAYEHLFTPVQLPAFIKNFKTHIAPILDKNQNQKWKHLKEYLLNKYADSHLKTKPE